MGRIAEAFESARANDRAAFIVYLCAGDPHLSLTPRLIGAAARGGADIVEVGVPFSDPTADGPTIQRASERALAAGTTLPKVLRAIQETRALGIDVPIVLFGYFNPILQYGESRFAEDAAQAGVDGVLVVDLPPESAAPLRAPMARVGLDLVPLIAPTSTERRVRQAAEAAGSFLYYVSTTGVTGAQHANLRSAGRRAAAIAAETGRPVAVGFGIKTKAQVETVAKEADGVVMGSAVVDAIAKAEGDEAKLAAVEQLVAGCRPALSRSAASPSVTD